MHLQLDSFQTKHYMYNFAFNLHYVDCIYVIYGFMVVIFKYSLDCNIDLIYHITLYSSFGWPKFARELAILKANLYKGIDIIITIIQKESS